MDALCAGGQSVSPGRITVHARTAASSSALLMSAGSGEVIWGREGTRMKSKAYDSDKRKIWLAQCVSPAIANRAAAAGAGPSEHASHPHAGAGEGGVQRVKERAEHGPTGGRQKPAQSDGAIR